MELNPFLSKTLIVATLAITCLQGPLAQEMPNMTPRSEKVGKREFVVGKVSMMPWQHMIRSDMKKMAIYFDLETGGQTVAYSKGDITCRGPAVIFGTWLLTEGSSKRPGSKEVGSEIQFDVAEWACLDAKGAGFLIEKLADKGLSREEKAGIPEALYKVGKDAIPALVGVLGDKRVAWKSRVLLNEGELMNRPAGVQAPPEQWRETDVTVEEVAESALSTIVSPIGYEPPVPPNFKPISAGAPFRVESWPKWWEKNRGKSIEEIRESFKPVLDTYWKSKGVQQVVK